MVWLNAFREHPLLGAFVCFFLALLAMALRQLAHRSRLARRLDVSFTLIAFGLVFGGVAIIVRTTGVLAATPYLDALLFGALAIGVVRAALTLFVDFYLQQREGAAVSAIIRDVSSVVAYFLVIVIVLRSTLDINLTSLVATSAVLTVIVGLALQDVLSNLFSGLVLELEQPFSPGDWVRIGAFEGTVQETGWRTTKLRTRLNELVTLPNVMLSKEAVVNYSRPDPLYGDTLQFEAAYEAPPNLVKETVMQVLADESAVKAVPTPEVRVEKFLESGVGYMLRYWITDFGDIERIRSRILTNLWYALRRANVRIPFPARDLFVYPGVGAMPEPERADLLPILRAVPLLAPLDEAALVQLAPRVRRMTFGRDEIVVREGDLGDSFYVIERGEAEVLLADGDAAEILGHLQPGSFFGEMSLLAGEPRTATVRAATDLAVLVIDRDAFKDVISADPALLGPLSEIAARRQAAQQEHRRFRDAHPVAVDVQQAQRLRERIKAFFRL